MAIPVIMPRQGQSVESCIISEWFVKKGDKVKEGDRLFSYETDKAAFEEESTAEGTILEIFFDEGDDVPVLTNVCVIGEEGEDISQFIPENASQKPQPESMKQETGAAGEPQMPAGSRGEAGKEQTAFFSGFYFAQSKKPGEKTGAIFALPYLQAQAAELLKGIFENFSKKTTL